MSTLYMIRHGQASFGSSNYDKLSQTGLSQAQLAADYLFNAGIEFRALYTGSMVRHRETLGPLLELIKEKGRHTPPVLTSEEFNEYDWLGVLSEIIPQLFEEDPVLKKRMPELNSDKKFFQEMFERAILRWVSGEYRSATLPQWSEFLSRVHRGLARLMMEHGSGHNIAVFTSGGPIGAVIQKVLNLSGEDAVKLSWQIINASITRFKFTNDRVMISTFNEHSFLELQDGQNMVTYR